MPPEEITVWYVLAASMLTAVCTGLGVIPFLFVRTIEKGLLGIGNAVAAGLMLGASLGLIYEACSINIFRMTIGISIGAILVIVTKALLPDENENSEHQLLGLSKAGFRKVVMIMGVMTAHSFAEGIGVGVSFGGREGLGTLISTAIAIHNIPEGIAICLVLIPRGISRFHASLWSIFSSLPQPLMAVPAFLFVLFFKPFLPVGLGLAAGAMIYMVFFELLPDSYKNTTKLKGTLACVVSTVVMLLFQMLL